MPRLRKTLSATGLQCPTLNTSVPVTPRMAVGLQSRVPPFHGGNRGSSPLRDATYKRLIPLSFRSVRRLSSGA